MRFLSVANANNTVLLDSTRKPLPSDFGALLEQLGRTNLHLAARYGHVEMVRYYLSLDLDPDAVTPPKVTRHTGVQAI